MRSSLSVLIIAAWWSVAPLTYAQTAPTQPAGSRQIASQPAAAAAVGAADREPSRADASGRSPAPQHSRKRHAADTTQRTTAATKGSAVLNLGATDITGNKELPKVMVIVPWKGSLGAGGVIKPTDSLLDEVLQPVDRGVFQRRIRYYGQLNTAGGRPAGRRVAPVGDSR